MVNTTLKIIHITLNKSFKGDIAYNYYQYGRIGTKRNENILSQHGANRREKRIPPKMVNDDVKNKRSIKDGAKRREKSNTTEDGARRCANKYNNV